MRDTQHLDKLRISGFRGLSSLGLDDLGSFNILLGANDVGKTYSGSDLPTVGFPEPRITHKC